MLSNAVKYWKKSVYSLDFTTVYCYCAALHPSGEGEERTVFLDSEQSRWKLQAPGSEHEIRMEFGVVKWGDNTQKTIVFATILHLQIISRSNKNNGLIKNESKP